MADRRAFGRGAVRKYWLAQDFIRSIALDTIEDVKFVDGDIHRQLIKWKSGAQVYVNRGDKDWQVAGKILPQYGYFAKNGQIESSIEKIQGIIVEQSSAPSRCPLWDAVRYFNARGFNLVKPKPKAEPSPRLNVKRIQIDFGPVVTESAFRCRLKGDIIVVTPLPDLDPFTVTLRTDKLTGTKDKYATSVSAIDADDKNIRSVEFDAQNTQIQFQTRENEFAYKIVLKRL